MNTNIIVLQPEQLTKLIEDTMERVLDRKLQAEKPKTYSINQAKKILKKGDKKIKEFISKGILNVTKDNRITEYELNKYLGKE